MSQYSSKEVAHIVSTAVTNEREKLMSHLEWAWSIIASAGPEGCIGNWKKMDLRWVEVAEKWRDGYHAILDKAKATTKEDHAT